MRTHASCAACAAILAALLVVAGCQTSRPIRPTAEQSRLEPADRQWLLDQISLQYQRIGCGSVTLDAVTLLPRHGGISIDGGYMRVQHYHERWRVQGCGTEREYQVWGDVNRVIFDLAPRRSGPGYDYDAEAIEVDGVIVGKKAASQTYRRAADGRLDKGPYDTSIAIYEYTVRSASAGEVTVESEYFGLNPGDCVRLFLSSRPGYPRIAPGMCPLRGR